MADGPTLLLITNPLAGAGDESAIAEAVKVLRARADVRIAECSDPRELRAALGRREGRMPVVCGGDGSLNLLVGELRRRTELADTDIGLIPLGTGNDLARGVGVPLAPEQAAATVLDGYGRPLDLLVADEGGVAVNAVHLGAGAEAARRAQPFKSRLGRFAFPMGSLLAGLGMRGLRLKVIADGRTLARRRVLMVGLANGPTIAGGRGKLAPRAVPDDGLVDVVVSAAIGPVARVGYALHLLRGVHEARADVRTIRARRVVIIGEPFEYNADGDLGGPVTHQCWRVEPQAWRLRVPQDQQVGGRNL
ncbi:MAG: lipid kinase [Streptosporangiales bacterium]|nr:lipid kinase [Streptosporangiales bacterium]